MLRRRPPILSPTTSRANIQAPPSYKYLQQTQLYRKVIYVMFIYSTNYFVKECHIDVDSVARSFTRAVSSSGASSELSWSVFELSAALAPKRTLSGRWQKRRKHVRTVGSVYEGNAVKPMAVGGNYVVEGWCYIGRRNYTITQNLCKHNH